VSNICWWAVNSKPSSVIVTHLVGVAVNIDYTLHDVLLLQIILCKSGTIKRLLHQCNIADVFSVTLIGIFSLLPVVGIFVFLVITKSSVCSCLQLHTQIAIRALH
jgi:hypothetical protein